jgi:hypothetical protein
VRARQEDDVRILAGAMTALETSPEPRPPGLQRAIDDLRDLRKRKEESLEKPVDDNSGLIKPPQS